MGAVGSATAPIAVGLDAAGKLVPGAGQTGIVGVLIISSNRPANARVDYLDQGELVEFGGAIATKYYADPADGVISINRDRTVAASGVYLGYTIEADRFIVRLGRAQ